MTNVLTSFVGITIITKTVLDFFLYNSDTIPNVLQSAGVQNEIENSSKITSFCVT